MEYINQWDQKYIILLKRHAKRIRETEEIPLEQFHRFTEYERIVHIPACLRNYTEETRLVVIELTVEEERFLFGCLTKDYDRLDEEIAELYPTRWDSEFWIEEMSFMNLKHLPSTDLSKISFNLSAKLVAYNTMSAFRGNLGEEHIVYKEQALLTTARSSR